MFKSLKEMSEILRYKELLRNLVSTDIKVRYKRSVLGFMWVMLNPLLIMLVLYIVFSTLFHVSVVYILSGIILWNFFSQSTSTALNSFIGNSNLIKKVYLPKAIFPLSVILSAMVNFAFSLVPLFIILSITGLNISPYLILVPVVLVMIAIFSFGISLIVSTLTVFFHDTKYIYEVFLLAWMYMTPIFYPESIISGKFSIILHLNPVYYYVSIFRMALSADVHFMPEKLLYGFLSSLLALVAGWIFYNRNRNRIVYYL
ncbi:MAG: ABC transporter permease [Nitrospiraceae bacterium]|nr:MAG: ABC transporter permease [Nitrospiraceae bacterium]